MSKSFNDLIAQAKEGEMVKVAVSNAQDDAVLEAVRAAKDQGIADAILFGNEAMMRQIAAEKNIKIDDFKIVNNEDVVGAALDAVKCVHDKEADILMKGFLETKDFLKSVLNKEVGLRTDKLMSHICVFECEGIEQLLFFTDVAFNTYPTLEQKADMIRNAASVAKACGIDNPKVAPLAAVETVNPKMPCTVEAQQLTEMNKNGEITGCEVYGPLSMDLAIDPEAARHKRFSNPVAGHADILVFPDIHAGNITYKILKRTGKVRNGNVMAGAAAPIILTSRSDDAETKINSIAFAAAISKGSK